MRHLDPTLLWQAAERAERSAERPEQDDEGRRFWSEMARILRDTASEVARKQRRGW